MRVFEHIENPVSAVHAVTAFIPDAGGRTQSLKPVDRSLRRRVCNFQPFGKRPDRPEWIRREQVKHALWDPRLPSVGCRRR